MMLVVSIPIYYYIVEVLKNGTVRLCVCVGVLLLFLVPKMI